MQIYTDQSRTVPVAEIWYVSLEDGPNVKEGWYWGHLPDSEPYGPFPTEADAIEDATRGD